MADQPIRKVPHMNPYDYHKYLINEYVLKKPGDTKFLQQKDTSKWKTDRDVIFENMKFIWNEDDQPATWEERLAKKYYDKLFREYCICNLSKFKENKLANRFRTEKEVVGGKGQFTCGEISCTELEGLKTWEVNFAYAEAGEKKNALVKIRLCPSCSEKLNYHSRKREVKRLKKTKKVKVRGVTELDETQPSQQEAPMSSHKERSEEDESSDPEKEEHYVKEPLEDENLWKKSTEVDIRGRDEEFDDYLADLLL